MRCQEIPVCNTVVQEVPHPYQRTVHNSHSIRQHQLFLVILNVLKLFACVQFDFFQVFPKNSPQAFESMKKKLASKRVAQYMVCTELVTDKALANATS